MEQGENQQQTQPTGTGKHRNLNPGHRGGRWEVGGGRLYTVTTMQKSCSVDCGYLSGYQGKQQLVSLSFI